MIVQSSSQDCDKVYEQFINAEELCEKNAVFLSSEAMYIQKRNNQCVVHVITNEMAIVSMKKQAIHIVGSDDATTCNIVIFGDEKQMLVAHLDQNDQMEFVLQQWQQTTGARRDITPVYIVGGYDDEQGISKPITLSILQALMNSTCRYCIELFVTGPTNTIQCTSHALPKVRGIAYVAGTESFHPTEFSPESRLPLIPQRFLGQSASKMSILFNDIDSSLPRCQIGPFQSLAFWGEYKMLLEYPDEIILKYTSTSPFAEGAKFVQDIRDTIQYASTHATVPPAITYQPDRTSGTWVPSPTDP